MKLQDLQPGTTATITKCDDDRLRVLGFLPGRSVTLVSKGFTCIVVIDGAKYAMRLDSPLEVLGEA